MQHTSKQRGDTMKLQTATSHNLYREASDTTNRETVTTHYRWRLIQCYRGSSDKYDTIRTRIMSEEERDAAQKQQDKTDSSKVWVR